MRALRTSDTARLERRLSWDGLDGCNAVTALAAWSRTPGIEICDERFLANARSAITAAAKTPIPPCSPADDTASVPLPFVDIWSPAVEAATQSLAGHLNQPSGLLAGSKATLLATLCRIGQHALAAMFDIERGMGAVLAAQMQADWYGGIIPPRDDYHRFINRHRRDGLTTLLKEFPVLGRLIGQELRRWTYCTRQVIERIAVDRLLLQSALDIPSDVPLVGLDPGLGDPHRGGQTTSRLTFADSRGRWQIAYKPRSLALEAAFNDALYQTCSSHQPSLRTARILNRESYGYVEWITRRPSSDTVELTAFYHNAGRLAAFLYVMGASDCHNKNLIAQSDQLVPIDIETLFEPQPRTDVRKSLVSGKSVPHDSIAYSGMLPKPQVSGSLFDTSALGPRGVFPSVQDLVGWVNVNSDWMCWRYVSRPIDPPESSPVIPEQPNPFFDHVDDFSRGFIAQCGGLIEHRESWLRHGGVLDAMAGITRRMVLRPTRVYAAIQAEQYHASALRSAVAQRLVLEQLTVLYLTTDQRPRDWAMLSDEIGQMEAGDIPYFHHRVDRSDLILSDDGSIDSYFVTTGLDECRNRLTALDQGVIQRQVAIIHAAISGSGI